jgi:hypothetical protein
MVRNIPDASTSAVAGFGQGQAGVGGQALDHATGEAPGSVDARPHRGAAEGQLTDAGQGGLQALDAVLDRCGVPAELLAEGDRRGVHEMRPA